MKRISLLAVLICTFLLAFSGVAYASFGVHGGYALDTDACAGCHRAHTSFSEATWTDYSPEANTRSALLVSNARTISDFCNVCHGNDAPGASTNVMGGVFDSGPSADQFGDWDPDSTGIAQLYDTNSTFDAQLNGGGFLWLGGDETRWATSVHNMEAGNLTDPMWGGGLAWQPLGTNLTCTSCHDPHGSSNYRILKDRVNNQTVGGYSTQGVPDPWVISNEEGYPLAGWWRGEVGAGQMVDYVPNYTSPEYGYKQPVDGEMRSMSGWCAACHTNYHNQKDPGWVVSGDWGSYGADFGTRYATDSGRPDGAVANGTAIGLLGTETDYEAGVGLAGRHRHPVNITLGATTPEQQALGDNPLALPTRLDDLIPLEPVPGTYDRGDWGYDSYIGCLTCHFAHGSDAEMGGFAAATLEEVDGFESIVGVGWCGWTWVEETSIWIPVQYEAADCYPGDWDPLFVIGDPLTWPDGFDPADWPANFNPFDSTTWPVGGWALDPDTAAAMGKNGVNPNFSSSLLRVDDRGVCQRCHYK